MIRYLILILILFFPKQVAVADAAQTEMEDRVRAISSELRCVVCQNLSVADSPSEMAQQMRAIVHEQLQQGKTPEEIKAYFVSKYGEWVLLAPSKKGFSLLVWVLPFVAAAAGILFVIFALRHWTRQSAKSYSKTTNPALLARVRDELTGEIPVALDPEELAAQSPYERERARLYADLRELEFDYQAGKFSEADYSELRRDLENKAAVVLEQIDASRPTEPAQKVSAESAASSKAPSARTQRASGFRRWKIALGGAFLLLFGLALGVLLTQALRPRGSTEDSITGDFLTGTGPRGIGKNSSDINSLLRQGRAAFAAREWPKAIKAFKAVLSAEPNQPEAHTYMGLILVQAGHADGALAAFDRALGTDPNFPLALWGKGMVLYRNKQDHAGARQILEKLTALLPPGKERAEVEKILAELPVGAEDGSQTATPGSSAGSASAAARIQGTITIDPKLKDKVDSRAMLFIIARSADSSAGPPLAVKKIERPVFPLFYTLGQENVMMQGMPFAGPITISARLDKDGNAMTREAGDLTGEPKNNRVEVGTTPVDIVIDRVAP